MSELAPKTRQVLYTLPALRVLGAADRERVAELFQEVVVAEGASVFREGDAADALYVVAAGSVRVVSGDRLLAHLGPGEWFGEMALITGEPRSASVEAALESRLLRLRAEDFARLLAIQPRLYRELAAVLSRRLAVRSRGKQSWSCRVVAIDNRGRWPERRALVEALASAVERELERPVAILTLAPRSAAARYPPRQGRPDLVLGASARSKRTLRDRVGAQVAALSHRVPLVIVDADDALADLTRDLGVLADTLLLPGEADEPVQPAAADERVIALRDSGRGPRLPLSGCGVALLPERDPGRTRALERLARVLTHRSVGVALGSGAAYGLAHIGVLQALDAGGVPVDFVAGASMGAIVGAHYAHGVTPERMREAATQLSDAPSVARLLPRLLYVAMDWKPLGPGMFSGERLLRSIESLAPLRGRSFADLQIPFRAVATDLETGARVEIGDGELGDALRASISAPWVLAPHSRDGRILMDGGICDPVPSETLRGMGADLVIAVNVVPPPDPRAGNPLDRALRAAQRLNPLALFNGRRALPNSFDVVLKTLQIMQHELGNARAGEADFLICPELARFWLLGFWDARELIAAGARAGAEAVPAIRKKLDERPGEAPGQGPT